MSTDFRDQFRAAGEQVAAELREQRERREARAQQQAQTKSSNEAAAVSFLEQQFTDMPQTPEPLAAVDDDFATQFSKYIRSQH